MHFLIAAIGLALGGGLFALAAGFITPSARLEARPPMGLRLPLRLGQGGLLAAAILACAGAVPVLLGPSGAAEFHFASLPPLGHIVLRYDAVSALFILPAGLFAALTAISGGAHLAGLGPKAMGAHWFFACLLFAGMLLVLGAENALFFIIAWEIMSLAPFFLLFMRGDAPERRQAAWLYLVMAHLGALVLMLMFTLMTDQADSYSFAAFARLAFDHSGALFCLALAGFGVKCGLIPLHLWLPGTYAAAPPFVTPLLSGAMINMGIYGIIRVLTFLGAGEPWWAYLMIGAGFFTAFMGILLALAQSDIKRSLAYSSAENMGIVLIGLGFGLLNAHQGSLELAALAYCGALLHLVNHSLFKGLLFSCAGAVELACGVTRISLLGGVQRRMPGIGLAFAAGCAALSALPPFNGFAGEFLLYVSFILGGEHSYVQETAWLYWSALVLLAFIGALALLCFTKIYGLAFLGNPRPGSPLEEGGEKRFRPAPPQVFIPCLVLAGMCLISGLAAPLVVKALRPAILGLPGMAAHNAASRAASAVLPESLLGTASLIFLLLIATAALLFAVRHFILRGRETRREPTWDCGYSAPNGRMQYSGLSFSGPMIRILRTWLQPVWERGKLIGYFPAAIRSDFAVKDLALGLWNRLLFKTVSRVAAASKRLQHGLLNVYILYIVVALVLALAFTLGFTPDVGGRP